MRETAPPASGRGEQRSPTKTAWLSIAGLAFLANGYGSAAFVAVIGPGLWYPATAASIWAAMTLASSIAALVAFVSTFAVVSRLFSSPRAGVAGVAISVMAGALVGPLAARAFILTLGLLGGELAPETWLDAFPI